MPIRSQSGAYQPIRCQSANWCQLANPVPIGHSGVNQSIQCQSANLVPILCQSDANPAPIFRLDTNSPICQSWPIRVNQANPCQSMPILCQSGVNFSFRLKFANLPILANLKQSEPIRANPVPIRCQSGANFLLRLKFANLCQSDPIHANPCQSLPILCQSGVNFSFRHKFANLPILANPCQSMPIRANPCQYIPIRCQWGSIFRSHTNLPICQSWPIRATPCQSDANPVPIRANRGPIFRYDTNLPICQSEPIRCQSMPIRRQFFVPTQIHQYANPSQSVPIRANPQRHKFFNLPI